MFKNIFYRSCALVSELEDTLRHLYRWHRSWSTPPRDRVLDMYALEDRVLFSIAPIVKAAALQAGAGGTGAATAQNPQASAMPAPDQTLLAVHRGHAGQDTRQAFNVSINAEGNAPAASWANLRARHDAKHPHAEATDRRVDFAIIDDSLQNLDQLIRSLDPKSEVLLYDHLKESPTDVLNRVYNWAKTNHAEIGSLSILSHGTNGSFVLGNQWLNSSNLAESAQAWQRLGAAMAPGGSIDIFGCNVAAGSNGQNLINDIGRLSRTTVFASVDNTGIGGNWNLEAASIAGNPAAWHNPLDTQILQQWKYELAPGITVTANPGLTTTESGGTAQFTVVLDAAPMADVKIPISSSNTAEGTVSTSMLTFTTANWNLAQTVTVTGVDDSVIDGNIAYTIIVAPAISQDPFYYNLDAGNVSVTNIDNDMPGVQIVESGGSTDVTEGGATDSYTVQLATRPTGDVTITCFPDSQVGVSLPTLTFTSDNWSTPQTIIVAAVDDQVAEGLHTRTITHSATSSDPNYNGISVPSVTAHITDNDVAGVIIIQSGGSTNVAEGGIADTYTVQLATQPTDDVTVTLTPDSQLNVSVPTLTFNYANWNTPQQVTVTAVDDNVAEGMHLGTIAHSVSSIDPFYTPVNIINVPSVIVHISDNDGITVTPTGGLNTTQSGGTATFQVVLDVQPTADVTIALSTSDATQGVVSSASSLTFTHDNWNQAQTVTVTGVNDHIDRDDIAFTIVTASAVSNDQMFNGTNAPDVAVTNINTNTAGVNITPTNGLTTSVSGGTAQFTAALNSKPMSDVTVIFNSSDPTAGTINALGDVVANYINDYSNMQGQNGWYYGYFVNGQFHQATWQDLYHEGAYKWQSPYGNTLYPGGGGGSLESVLRYVAQENGTYRLDANFAEVSWGVNKGDGLIEHVYLNGTEIWSSIIPGDNTTGVHLTKDLGLKAGDTLDFYVGQYLTAAGGYDSLYFPITLQRLQNTAIFTPDNWNDPQTITVAGVDSDAVDDVAYQVTGYASSSDDHYNGISVPGVNLTNIVNEAPGVRITQTSGSTNVTEGARTDTYTVRLTTQPGANVTVTLTANSPNNQLSVSHQTLTFTPDDWDNAQSVTVSAVNDNVIEGPYTGTIAHSVASDDSHYNSNYNSVADLTVNIVDTAPAGVTITPSSGLITTEAGGTAQYSVVLNSRPTSNVTIAFDSSDTSEGAASALGSLMVNYNTNLPWGDNQGFNNFYFGYFDANPGTGLIDTTNFKLMSWTGWCYAKDGNPDHGAFFTWSPAGGWPGTDPAILSWPVIKYVVQQSGTFNVTASFASTNSGAGDGITGRLFYQGQEIYSQSISQHDYTGINQSMAMSLQAGDVFYLAIDPGKIVTTDDFTLNLSLQIIENRVTFTPDNWMFPQTFTIKGADDTVADGNVAYTLNPTITASDNAYSALRVPAINVTNIDNDAPILITPSTQSTTADVIFSDANGNAVKVQNVDTSSNPLHVQLTATNGSLTLSNTAGLTFVIGNGHKNTTMELLGSAVNVNAALEGMRFSPTAETGNLQLVVNIYNPADSNNLQPGHEGSSLMAIGFVGIQVCKAQSQPPSSHLQINNSDIITPISSTTSFTAFSSLGSLQTKVNSNLEGSLENSNIFVRAESPIGDKLAARSINAIMNKSKPAEVASVDVSTDYLSTRDRFQTYAMQPIVTKISGANLTLQSVMDTQVLWQEIKTLAAQGETLPWLSRINVGTVIGLSAGLSAGYIMMAFRWGALITSGLAATYPAWQWIDPLPILESSKDKSDNQKLFGESEQNAKSQLNESLESLMS